MSAVDGIDEFAAKLAGILKEKNAAYGDSFARVPTILAGMYQGVPPETLEGILFNARIQDKLGRIAKDPLAAGEDAYLDLAGYALLMANVQRLKREAKPNGAPTVSDVPAVVPATEWVIKRHAEGRTLYLCTFDAGRPEWSPSEERAIRYLSRRAADIALAGHLPAEPSAEVEAKAEPPSEPNGRIKRDILPYVKVSEWPTGWYLSCLKGVQGADTMFFNAYAGGFWGPDRCNATSFPSADAAEAYLRKQAELNGAAPVGIPPAKVDANKGVPSVVRTGSVLARPHTSHRVSDDGWVVCRNGRYLNCHRNAWELFPDWATQFPSEEAAEVIAKKVRTGTIVAHRTGERASCE